MLNPDKLQQMILKETYGVPAKLAAQASDVGRKPIHEDNIGHRMLKKLGKYFSTRIVLI